MGKIIFVNPFWCDKIYGGVKVVYQHASILAKSGYEVSVWQPDGKPAWIDIPDRLTVCDSFEANSEDIVVYPEVLADFIYEMAATPVAAKKVLFCQNHYYLYSYNITGTALREMGFEHFIVPGHEAARSLKAVLGIDNVHVIPNSVDTGLFYPRQKLLYIATSPRKWPAEGDNAPLSDLIKTMLHLKYPEASIIPWVTIENMKEREVAEIMGGAAIFLALSRQEALPLTPLEAMASRCVLVGFSGTGGKDYATQNNGHWFSPEQCEEIVDCLASVAVEITHDAPRIRRMLDDAEKTALQYSVGSTYRAVNEVYGEIRAQLDG